MTVPDKVLCATTVTLLLDVWSESRGGGGGGGGSQGSEDPPKSMTPRSLHHTKISLLA